MAERAKLVLNEAKELLTMANCRDSNEFESQTTILKIQILLKKQNSVEDSKIVVDSAITKPTKNPWWKLSIANIICENFRCKAYRKLGTGGSCIRFIGLEQDIELAKEVFHFAVESMVYYGNRIMRRVRNKRGYIPKGCRNDFYNDYIKTLEKKFTEQVDNDKDLANILIKDILVVREIDKLPLKQSKRLNIVIQSTKDN